MRLAVISDIHANMEALQEVMADIALAGADRIIALGDIVGYGPDPDAVVDLIRCRQIPTIMGNHEYALHNESYFLRLNEPTRKTTTITRSLLSADNLAFLATLKRVIGGQHVRFVHGCPPASFSVYLFSPAPSRLQKLFAAFEERRCFIGHTHDLVLHSTDGEESRTEKLQEGMVLLEAGRRYIINVGSVGQPRDALGNKAKYVIWDSGADTLEVRFVSYDIGTTVEKILARGFPEYNAYRLW